jgi:hypothetical protein
MDVDEKSFALRIILVLRICEKEKPLVSSGFEG